MHTVICFQVLLFYINNSKTVLFQTIQFSMSFVCAQFKCSSTQFECQTVLFDPERCYHPGAEWTWERWQWKGTPHSPKLQYYWSFTIWLFSVITRTLVEEVLPLCRNAVGVFYSSSQLGCYGGRVGWMWYTASIHFILLRLNEDIIYTDSLLFLNLLQKMHHSDKQYWFWLGYNMYLPNPSTTGRMWHKFNF